MGDDPAVAARRLRALAADLDGLDLRLDDEGEAARAGAVRLIREVLVPRLEDDMAPLVVAVIGPSGSGKSTLVNTLAGAAVVTAGPLRPTTRTPTMWSSHPPPQALDAVRRVHGLTEAAGDGRPPPDGLVLVDAPPAGPAVTAIVDAADVGLVVASDRRYADAAMWDLVERAATRRLPMVFVLGRLPIAPEAQRPLLADFAGRLADRGLVARPDPESIIGIPEAAPGTVIPVEWAAGVRKELEVIAEPATRRSIRRRVMHAALGELRRSLSAVRAAVVDAEVRRRRLLDPVAAIYRGEAGGLVDALTSGGLADLAGSGETLPSDLAAVAVRRTGRAARAAAQTWSADPVGRALLEDDRGLWSHDPAGMDRARGEIDDWRADIRAAIDSGAPRLTRRATRAAMTDLAAAGVLGCEPGPVDRRTASAARRLARMPAVMDDARRRLAAVLEGIVMADGRRFVDTVGRGPEPGLLSRLLVEAGEAADE